MARRAKAAPAPETEPAEKPDQPAAAVTGDKSPPSVEPGGAAPPASTEAVASTGRDTSGEATGRDRGEPAAGEDASAADLVVVGPSRGFWRAGRRFGPEPTVIPLADLTEDQIGAILREPALVATFVEMPAD